jgi:hypothetical protein
MSDYEYRSMRIGELLAISKRHFSLRLAVTEILFEDIETSPHSSCTIFRSDTNDLYGLFVSNGQQTLADVKRYAKQIGVKIDGYYAPQGERAYFKRNGFIAFQRAYPGRNSWTPQEAAYYSSLAPYTIGLVHIAKVDGHIRRFSRTDAHWRDAFNFRYVKAKVQ